jgi:dynein heavy chain
LRNEGAISDDEWNLFLKGVAFIPAEFVRLPNPDSTAISDKSWDIITMLQNIAPPFKEPVLLGQHITNNLTAWKAWIDSKEPHNDLLPEGFEEITTFQKILLLKAFRDEKITFAAINFVTEHLGKNYVSVPPTNMMEAYEDTKNRSPIIFILSVGADPNSLMRNFA